MLLSVSSAMVVSPSCACAFCASTRAFSWAIRSSEAWPGAWWSSLAKLPSIVDIYVSPQPFDLSHSLSQTRWATFSASGKGISHVSGPAKRDGIIELFKVKCRAQIEWWCKMRCTRCWYFVSTCLASLDARALAGWRTGESGSRGCLNVGLRMNSRGHLSGGLWMIGGQETTSARARQTSHISHQRNASQIPRTEGACTSIAAIKSTNTKIAY